MVKRRSGFWSACWSLDNVDCDRTAWENGWACMSGIPRVDVFVTMLAVRLGQRCRWWVSCSDEAEPVCLEGARLAGAATSRLDLDLAPMGRRASVPAACMGAGALGRVPEHQALRQSSSTWACPTRKTCPGVGIISKRPASLTWEGATLVRLVCRRICPVAPDFQPDKPSAPLVPLCTSTHGLTGPTRYIR